MCHSSWAEEGQDGCPRGGGRRRKAKTNVNEMNVPETDVPEAEEGGGKPGRMSLRRKVCFLKPLCDVLADVKV